VGVRAVSGDVELEYEVRGDGPQLVWLHGLSGSLEESRPLCERLATSYRVLWYSTRGHGRSSPVHEKERYRYDCIVDDLERMLDKVGFEHPVVAGGSHGANTALRHAVRYPGRSRALLLVAPGANALARPDRLRWGLVRGQMALAARRGEPHVVKAITGHNPLDPSLDEAALAAVAAARTHDLASLLSAMRLIPDQRVVNPSVLPSLEVPALVAAWPKDPVLHPIKVARRIADLLPKGEFVEIDRPSSMTPDSAAALMSDWVEGLLARSL
jgi:pimeloyl-ACP methyl ester carboxylesterase